jgi:osmotically-inducible protein OsmY
MRITVGTMFMAAIALGGLSPAFGKQIAGAEQAKLAHKIESRLRNDTDLKNNRITVEVDNGVATLKGSVDTQNERTKAEDLARVDGIVRVDDQLDVGSAGAGAAFTDSAITAKLKTEIVTDGALKNSDISVTTNNGVVILEGSVPNQAEHDHVVSMVQRADGVKRVSDNLRIAAKQ